MIKLYCGEDTFDSYINAKQEAFKISKNNKTEVKIINLDDLSDINDLLVELEGVGMFAEQKTILGKRLYSNKKLLEYFVNNFEKLNKFDIILWEEKKADGKLKLTKLLKKEAIINNYEKQKPWQIGNWLDKVLNKKNISLNKSQKEYLLERTDVNKWIILNEVNKIDIYLKTNKKENLEDKELQKILGFDARGDIWQLTEYFSNLDSQKTLKELQKIFNFEDNAQYIIAMLNRELQILNKVKYVDETTKDFKSLKMHPFVLQKALKKVKNLTLEKIRKLTSELLETDFSIKKGEIQEKLALKLYILGINEKQL